MINCFMVEAAEKDQNNYWHNIYIKIDTPNISSAAMQSMLAGYLNVSPAEVKPIPKYDFMLFIEGEKLIHELQ